MSRIQSAEYGVMASHPHLAEVDGHPGPRLTGHLPALDALRGIAVLLVFLFHADMPGFSGAFIGVDIFFVLSGFLITVLLLQEHQNYGKISLRHFYMRRLLRLMPALLLMLVVFVAFCYWYFPNPIDQLRHLQDAFMVLFYAANWTRAFDLHRPAILGHGWSLSIEEQFYALWPLMLILMLRLHVFRRILAIAALLFISWGWRLCLLNQGASWDRVYNGFGCRADMLLAGCLLASLWNAGYLSGWQRRFRFVALGGHWVAALALGALIVTANWQTPELYRWQYGIVAFAASIVILELVNHPQAFMGKLLCRPSLIWTGRVSYGLYLWHYPIIYFLNSGCTSLSHGQRIVIAALLTLICVSLSWYFLEQPLLRMKKSFI
ncbi:MAG: acyltransferase [Desulfobacterales bacterium]|nr:acyltransferase [Desulfobacterales bacterium]MDD4073843.1 acyltransferase [Desulfobacterales bacterium]MDD4393508.1 acyltransferase [Desulfobacterales bacterium]